MTNKLHRNRKSRFITTTLAWGLSLVPALFATPPAAAQTFKLLYAFTNGADGGGPWGTPLLTGGILYCSAISGGGPYSGQVGSVFEFELFPNGGVGAPLYDFAGQPFDGAVPMGGLVTDGFGDFFGTTTQGGFSLHGTIYEISGGTEFVLYNFAGHDGADPEGSLFIDAVGNLYGTTSNGGANDSGTVFALSYGSLIQLYSFGNYKNDGIAPASSLLLHQGVVYGVTTEGGEHGFGTVFGVNVRTKEETVLYNFQGKKDGGTPVGGLALDGKGNLYGTTSVGGSARHNAGDGVVFKINLKSSQYSVVHTFTGPDGAQPLAGLLSDGQGNFYGTTYAGGAQGYGTVFELNSAGTLNTLYSFTNGTDGAYPYAGVTLDSSGNIYGVATRGGQNGWGTLFEIVP